MEAFPLFPAKQKIAKSEEEREIVQRGRGREMRALYLILALVLAAICDRVTASMSGCVVSGPAGFGATKDGTKGLVYTLKSDAGVTVDICTYGACITRLSVPDKQGKCEDIVLGCNDAAEYEAHSSYFGGIVGRVANRIRDGKFMLDGKGYALAQNNGDNSLHGGEQGYNKQHWSCEEVPNGVQFSLTSPDGDQGYPGEVEVKATYTLQGNTLRLHMQGRAATATPLNLAQHSYFNLAGHSSGKSILSHAVKLYSTRYTPLEDHLPTGEVTLVANTPFDFTKPQNIGPQIEMLGAALNVPAKYDEVSDAIVMTPQVEDVGENKFLGFDDNFVVDGPAETDGLCKVAFVTEPSSGRTLLVESDAPGVQFYTGNFLGDTRGKDKAVYQRHGGLCLETQHFPDSIGRDPNTPFGKGACPIVDGSRPYAHTVRYTFGVQ
jgi:aldose 1-epimerase